MRVWCVLVGLWLHCNELPAQVLTYHLPATSGAWSHSFYSPHAILTNPAMAGVQTGMSISIWGQQLYNIQGLKAVRLSSFFSIDRNSCIGAVVNRRGNSDYQDILAALVFGRKLSDHISAGVSLGIDVLKFKGFSSQQKVLSIAGICWDENNLSAGLVWQSIKGKPGDERGFSQEFTMGLGKDWSSNLYTDFALTYAPGDAPTFNSSIQYLPASRIILAVQVASSPSRYSIVGGWLLNKMRICITGSWQQPLGYTPGIEIGYTTSKVKGNE